MQGQNLKYFFFGFLLLFCVFVVFDIFLASYLSRNNYINKIR